MREMTVFDLCFLVVFGGVIGTYISQSLIPLLVIGVFLVILWMAFCSQEAQNNQGSKGLISGGYQPSGVNRRAKKPR